MSIYRGYEIKLNDDDTFGVHSQGSYPVIAAKFLSEGEAMDCIDAERRYRAAREQGQ